MGGEDSPSKSQEDNSKTEKDNEGQLTGQANVSPNRPPLLQKLNRMHGDSAILNNTGSFSPMQDVKGSKKRSREISSSDDEEIDKSSQKKRRLHVSTFDGPENVKSSLKQENLPCDLASEEKPCSFKLDTNENPKIKLAHQPKLELNVNSSSENMNSEKQNNDNRIYNEKDNDAGSPNTIPSKNSEITEKDETKKH